jgi:hypothetical protein
MLKQHVESATSSGTKDTYGDPPKADFAHYIVGQLRSKYREFSIQEDAPIDKDGIVSLALRKVRNSVHNARPKELMLIILARFWVPGIVST